MIPFRAPLEDIHFTLNDVAEAGRIPGWDADLAREMGAHFASFAEAEIAPLDAVGDREGCRLENGRVRMPTGFAEVYRHYAEQGWPGLTAPADFGGQGMGAAMLAVTSEIFSGACHSLQMVTGLVPGAIRTLLNFGTPEQQAKVIPQLVSGEWLSTMCLTEPGAGSDLSRIRCRAERSGEVWRITGEKIFISGGDQDMSEGILHLVLARTGGEGTRGLSLFLCPSHRTDGTRNAVTVTRIEEKMGLHASPTCGLTFEGADAEIVGEPGAGLMAMFTMMNHARLDVALQGVAHAARACNVGRTYAAERVQGRGPDGAEVTIDRHGDVRRMLDEIDSLALGARGVAHVALVEVEAGESALADLLTPLAKLIGAEAGIRAAEMGMQVLGGYGYLSEYRLEQTYRDARITAIYEGANGIHAGTLAGRMLRHDGGRCGDAFAGFLGREAAKGNAESVAHCRDLWLAARDRVLAAKDPGPIAHDFAKLTAEAMLAAVWARIGRAADRHPDPERIARLAREAARRAPILARASAELIG
ncbi:acyl-CoA dehydrogenase family protein [Ostreiculturibacter nitratireducens]|uniref:acyl-CoA dehydrogenase family protein n=1 Tax=Ostreiculturibacter nitratireducens TaxID=3075226 RepID=UPI0031B5CD02